MISFFSRDLNPQTVYPCSVEDLKLALSSLPQEDIEGLTAIGLVPSTRKRSLTNAEYIPDPEPRVHIFAYPDSRCFKLKLSIGELRQQMPDELSFGMETRPEGRWIECCWSESALRRFIACFVLLHEVGHHVYRFHLAKPYERKHWTLSEAFANRYARAKSSEAMKFF